MKSKKIPDRPSSVFEFVLANLNDKSNQQQQAHKVHPVISPQPRTNELILVPMMTSILDEVKLTRADSEIQRLNDKCNHIDWSY